MHAVEAKTGIPITLAVALKLILHRLGLLVHIVGLPTHVVLAVPDATGMTCMDVFDGGQVLSVSNCREIANRYGVKWIAQLREPLGATGVFSRRLRNVVTCPVTVYTSTRENSDSLFKIRAV
jgi:regulator of sirC expression with transglutaminase-like and TPR domain